MLVSRKSESVNKPLERSISDPHSSLGSLDISHSSFQSQKFFSSHLSCAVQVPRVWVPDVGHKPLTPQQEALGLEIFPYCVLLTRDGVFGETLSLLLLLISMWPLYLFLWRKLFS